MKRSVIVLLAVVVFTAPAAAQDVDLWPEIEPYETGYLKVSDVHELYYEMSGNRKGKAVMGLHGGPGGSSSPYMRRFFNPDVFHIVLYDQRGAGKSKPFAEMRDNTTQRLVEDIEKLRKHLKLDKVILFGGSWGSTLALAYAETYPENVAGLVLRGVFTARQKEIDHFYHGGVRKFFPDVYDNFIAQLPEPDRRPLPDYLLSLIQSDDADTRAKYARLWAEYEIKITSLYFPDDQMDELFEHFDPLAFAVLENYYMSEHCFLEEGQLIDNADKLRDIPLVIVNGRYDMACPPITAYELHAKLPKSKMVFAEGAGHWMGEEAVQSALLAAMREFE